MTPQKRLLFAAENLQEAKNLFPILSRLIEQDGVHVSPTFLSLDNVYHQNVEAFLDHKGVSYTKVNLSYPIDKSIYYYSRSSQLRFSISNHRLLYKQMDGFDAFLCGIAGMAQRSVAIAARNQGKLNFQVLTGRMSPSIANSKKNRSILKLYKTFPSAGFLFPGGYLAGSVFMDHIFCLGESDKQLIESMNLEGEIHNLGVPGFRHLFSEVNESHVDIESNQVRQLLYLTASYKWHRSEKVDYQKEALRELVKFVGSTGNKYRLVVKVHPREDLEDYSWLAGTEGVDIISGKIEPAINQAFVVIGVVSTGLFEAIKQNKIALCLMTGFPESDLYWDLVKETQFIPTALNCEDIAAILDEISSPQNYRAILKKQQDGVDFFISPSTPSSVENITKVILNSLSSAR